MSAGLRLVTLAILLGGWASAASADNCGAIENRTGALLAGLPAAADEIGAYRRLGDAAFEGIELCPQSPKLWYWAARAAEILEAPSAGTAFEAHGGAGKIALDAETHVPDSVGIATVVARVTGTEVAARRAQALDAAYPPARRALALTLLRGGSFDAALKLLPSSGGSGPDRVTRARILLAMGRPKDAVFEAREARDRPQPDPSEPSPAFEIVRDANEVLGFALLGQGRQREARGALQAAAAAGSQAARAALLRRP